jgi:hypothetical protein
MNGQCQIKDDDEIMEEEKNRYNFRRFTEEEIKNKYSPFERVKKKESPFLFQKKKLFQKDESKISLEDIISKFENVTTNDLSGNKYSSMTPPYPPSPISELEVKELNLAIEKHDLNELKTTNQIVVDNES